MNGLNRADLIGNLGGDPEFRTMQSGKPVATFSVATNEGYRDRESGDYKEHTEWHRVVTYQEGLIDMLRKHAAKGRQVNVTGKLRTRKWQDRDGNERSTTEIVVGRYGTINFLDKRNGSSEPPAPPPEAYEDDFVA